MTRVAFATYRGQPAIAADDAILRDSLAAHKIDVEAHPWDSDVEWTKFDAVLPRSTWDFHQRLPVFRSWLSELDRAHVRTINPSRMLAWNLTKRYLIGLKAHGVSIVPTLWFNGDRAASEPKLSEVTSEQGWRGGVVIKPAVSASAHETWIARGLQTGAEDRRFQKALAGTALGIMVQPLIESVATHGEWSIIFFRGEFSHAVLKHPAEGDFRVQKEHGGTSEPALPSHAMIDDAKNVLRAAAHCTQLRVEEIVYARVDGVDQWGRLLLMEFEALEPVLFFADSPAAATRAAAAIALFLNDANADVRVECRTPGPSSSRFPSSKP